ncbi:MAG: S46 family peptidase [Bacteroidetes bacterium]|nr:S46 family peptidase [Bacteroidota bacterium]
MKRILLFICCALTFVFSNSRADEGMWLTMLVERLNYVDMQKMGCKLTPEEIYSVNNACLKDAIVGLGNTDSPLGFFCTGEIISNEGLMLTNHHCGYESIQKHSNVDHDYLGNGFWAMTREEELPNEDMTASFLIRVEDVTEKVLSGVKDNMKESSRDAIIKDNMSKIQAAATKDTKYNASVKSFFEGNEYYLFVYQVYEDVRLVGAPPSSIGKFGGDVDNWMWPRHTGDFSMFRIYASKENEPAPYSVENVPLKPKYSLPVSIKGIKKDDFAMIMGYPGSTDRFLTSEGVRMEIENSGPVNVKVLGKKLEVMKKFMDADKVVDIQLANTYATTSNSWKYYLGEVEQLQRNNVAARKEVLEKEFTEWVKNDTKRIEKYGGALFDIKAGYEELKKYKKVASYIELGGFEGPSFILAGLNGGAYSMLNALKTAPDDAITLASVGLEMQQAADEFYKEFHKPTEVNVFVEIMKILETDVPAEYQPEFFKTVKGKFKGDWQKYADNLFAKSMFVNREILNRFVSKPSLKTMLADPCFIVLIDFLNKYFELDDLTSRSDEKIKKGYRLYIAGLREMQTEKKFYSDANSTQRLTFGQVKDYAPVDAVEYKWFTTLDGVVEKNDPDDDDFQVPEKLIDLFNKGDFGAYAESNYMPVCFLTTNDITGGNSGSPVLNGNGELIGVAFDGNWEAMSGDIFFETEVQRTICVDVRYVLFIIDKFAGAGHLVKEMEIRK